MHLAGSPSSHSFTVSPRQTGLLVNFIVFFGSTAGGSRENVEEILSVTEVNPSVIDLFSNFCLSASNIPV
jgi:hypothetical protein